MSELDVYLWTRLDSIEVILGIILTFIVIIYACGIIFGFIIKCAGENNNDDDQRKLSKDILSALKKGLFPVAIFIFIGSLIPTSKEYAMIKVLPRIANSELSAQIQKDVPELYQIAVSALKEKISPQKKV